jgi:WD40 repeat protein
VVHENDASKDLTIVTFGSSIQAMYNENDNGFKIHEFVAHSTEINCLSFGPKSHQVLATGGNDFKVNIWKVGNASNIWTLGQNKSPVECLCFDADEQYVVSGAMNGSIKVFDLNEGRLARNLSGHQVNTCSIQYHPYGEFIVSGSVDCTMKVWDVRNKACIQTYSGHKKEVTCVRFSPDGRWIASSGKDSQLLIWDLVAGKLLSTIRLDPAYVTSFEFNPAEFIIGAVTSNRNVRLWDLETMEPLSNTPPDSSPIRAMAFSGDGNSIFTGTKDSLKVFNWEPTTKLKNSVDIGWDKVAELRISPDGSKLTAGSFNSNFVSVWSVDLDKLSDAADSKRTQPQSVQRPARSKEVQGESSSRGFSRGNDRDSNNVDHQADAKSAGHSAVSHTNNGGGVDAPVMEWSSDEARTDMASTMGASVRRRMEEMQKIASIEEELSESKIGNPMRRQEDYCKASVPSAADAINSISLSSRGAQSASVNSAAADNSRPAREAESPSSSSSADRNRKQLGSPPPSSSGNRRDSYDRVVTTAVPTRPRSGMERASTPVAGSRGRTPVKPPTRAGNDARDHPASEEADRNKLRSGSRNTGGQSDPSSASDPKSTREEALRAAARRAAAASLAAANPASSANGRSDERPNSRIYVNGSDRDDLRGVSREQREDDVSSILDRVIGNSAATAAALSQRLSSMKILKRLWMKGDLQEVVEYMDSLVHGAVHDPSQLVLLADMFASVELKGNNFTLQICVGFMSILDAMVSTAGGLRVSAVVCAALKGFTELCVGFGDLIKSARSIQLGGAVDLTKEERLRKCHACHGVVFKMKERFEKIKQLHRADYRLMDIMDNLTPLVENILIF